MVRRLSLRGGVGSLATRRLGPLCFYLVRLRPVLIDGDVASVPLRRGTNPPLALIDASDAEVVGAYNWCLNPSGYVQRGYGPKGRVRNQQLHRFILGARPGTIVDHVNRNPLDCRRSNLRFVTHRENNLNNSVAEASSGVPTGVLWRETRKRFHVWVRSVEPGFLNNHHFLGEFFTHDEAERVYNHALAHPNILNGLP